MMNDGVKSNIRATKPETENGKAYHIRVGNGDVPGIMLLPGSPERAMVISKNWEDSKELAFYREFRTMVGNYKGTPIGCTSTGCGPVGAEIAIHELNASGVHTAIRVGSTGSISPRFDLGDIVIPVAAIRADGTSDCYVDRGFPAVANVDVVNALAQACENLGYKYGYGLMYCPASFYLGQGRKIKEDGYWPSFAPNIIPDLQSAGVTNIDTDTSGQYIVGQLHGMRMGAVMSIISNRIRDTWGDNGGEEKVSRVACEAVRILAEQDKKENPLRL